jgi:hypothetical protein
MTVNNILERKWKEVTMAYFKAVSQQSHGVTDKNHEKSQ